MIREMDAYCGERDRFASPERRDRARSGLLVALTEAMQAEGADTPPPSEVQEIVVTGSRLSTGQYREAVPVQVLSSDAFQDRAVLDAAAVLQTIPAAGGFQQDGSNQITNRPNAGIATVNLRGL